MEPYIQAYKIEAFARRQKVKINKPAWETNVIEDESLDLLWLQIEE